MLFHGIFVISIGNSSHKGQHQHVKISNFSGAFVFILSLGFKRCVIAEKETPWQTPFATNSFGDSLD
jgi:hypothetical protein